jgi:hypothetical protein
MIIQTLTDFGGTMTILSVLALLLLAVQALYYPGFTLGGLVGEFGGLLALIVLIVVTPANSERFWWTAAALGFLVLGHATYWVVTHPVNNAWLRDTNIWSRRGILWNVFHCGR